VRFTADQRYARTDADTIARTFADPALFEAYPGGDKLAAPEVVRHQLAGDIVEQDLRYRFIGDLSSAVRAVVDPARLSWVERSRHDLAARTTTFQLLPDHYADRLRCSGQVTIEPDGDGCRRVVTGDLKVRVALVGGSVERTLISDLQHHLRAEVAIVEAYLADRTG
jgi:hypothetical protein